MGGRVCWNVSGEIDSSNTAAVTAYTVRSILMSDAVLLDMSNVDFPAAQGLSVFSAVEQTCRHVEVPWILVASCAVDRVLQLSGRAAFLPIADSVQVAMQYFACLAHMAARPQGAACP
jgi:anti-anti-sigma factor